MLRLKFYGDESGDSDSSLFRVSGYLMTDEQFERWDSGIRAALGNELKYFHMNEGHHLSHPEIYRSLISLIGPDSVLAGFDVSLYESEYNQEALQIRNKQSLKYWIGDAYTFALQVLISRCGEWVADNLAADEYIAYFFESGHPREGNAGYFLNQLPSRPQEAQRVRARYASHTFIAKDGPLGYLISPCDILGWHLTNWQRSGNPQCDGLKSLLKTQTIYRHYSADDIRAQFKKQIAYWQTVTSKGRPRNKIGRSERSE